jgi:hypothetical protein
MRISAMTASSVLPAAIAAEENGPDVVRLTRKAPIAMPGHSSRPKRTSAATAIPVGGQIGDALALTEARLRPSLPPRK